jgi:hypothetical protein
LKHYEVLRDADNKPIVLPDHFRQLRLHKAWSIPQFAGAMPHTPDVDSPPEEKAKWALFTMFLFRPWRRPLADARAWCKLDGCDLDVDAGYAAIWTEYERWMQEDIEAVAAPCYSGNLVPSEWPKFSNTDPKWWPCMVSPRLRQWRFAQQRVQDIPSRTSVGAVPIVSDTDGSQTGEDASGDDGKDSLGPAEDRDCGEGADCSDDEDAAETARVARKFPTPVAHRCTSVQAFRLGHDFFLNPPGFQNRSLEAYYAQGFRSAAASSGLNALPDEDTPVLCPEPFFSAAWTPGESKHCAEAQQLLFTRLDEDRADKDVQACSPFRIIRMILVVTAPSS